MELQDIEVEKARPVDNSEDVDGPFVDSNDRPIFAVDEVSIGIPEFGGFRNHRASQRKTLKGYDLAIQFCNKG